MSDEYVAPIDHGVLSATGSVAAGTAGGAIKKGLKWGALWIGAFALGGALLASGLVVGTVSSIALGALGGAVVGTLSSPFAGVIGSAVGAITGGGHAMERVRQEKGAANEMAAQVDALKAQAYAPPANDNAYAVNDNSLYPAQGTQYNPAGSKVNAMQADGRISSQQLQRA